MADPNLCEQQYLAAGSPRMRTCFKLILADDHHIGLKNDIVKYTILNEMLKERKKERNNFFDLVEIFKKAEIKG